MNEFVPAIAMLALVVKVIDFLRYAKARDLNGVTTQVIAWIAGVVVLLLVAHTAWAQGILVGSMPLAKLNFWSVVFAGVSLASGASLAADTRKAVDNTNSAALPTLLPVAAASVPPATTAPARG